MQSHRSGLSLLLVAAVLLWADASMASHVMLNDAEPAAVASSIDGELSTCTHTESDFMHAHVRQAASITCMQSLSNSPAGLLRLLISASL